MKKLLVIVALFAGLVSATVALADPVNLNPIGYLFAGPAAGGMRVAVSGTYAYTTLGGKVFDVSNPAMPVYVTELPNFNGVDVVAFGRYLFSINPSYGLSIFNIGNPAAPVLVNTIYGMGGNKVAISGNYLFVASGYANILPSALKIIDFSLPTAPVLVASLALPAPAIDVAISGNYAFVIDQSSKLQVVDISKPAAPRQVSSLSFSTPAYGVAVSGTYAYVTTHDDYCDDYDYCGPVPGQLNVVDVSNPLCPRIVSTVATPKAPEGIALSGRYVYSVEASVDYSIDTCDFIVVDVGNPATPQVVAYHNIEQGQGLAIAGGNIYVPVRNGMYIFQTFDTIDPPQACTQ